MGRLLLVLVLLLGGCGVVLDDGGGGEPAARAAAPAPEGLPEGRDVTVTSITDGDTFRAGEERVRLIGIDTPEVSFGVECYGHEATAALERLIPVGTEVRLVGDVEPVDRYDRTLAYVYRRADGLHVNLRLAEEGYALPLTVPPNVAHERAFADAAARARQANLGLWSAC
ncbi:thermonuclease family protein [Iamia sp. SCSIO 61187]|uniref:thermonuclease family protein n=1 Tax=Iamia sp. SCSIO 61187 TaxID=2722752 RepID=UPI001C634A63|nr:thermonuclease family protein [Iamia sp. SCSIO 61187]QYG95002.1 thermonuclease family protein [Iamia sp. SCSIO 61187]